MRYLLAVALACAAVPVVASDPATAQASPLASRAERAASTRAYIECLDARAAEVDDGVSDAATIATAVAPMCRTVLREAATLQARGTSISSDRIYERLAVDEVARATRSVLQVRAARRASQP